MNLITVLPNGHSRTDYRNQRTSPYSRENAKTQSVAHPTFQSENRSNGQNRKTLGKSKWVDPAQVKINRQLTQARNWEAILQIIERDLENFDAVNTATAIKQLVSFHIKDQKIISQLRF
jgi:hypothetical protein